MLIKGSKDLDSSLVSHENFIEILLSSGWAIGQVTRVAKDLPHLWRHLQRPKNKIIFHFRL